MTFTYGLAAWRLASANIYIKYIFVKFIVVYYILKEKKSSAANSRIIHNFVAASVISLRDWVSQHETFRAYAPCVQTVKDLGTISTGP